MTSIRFMWTAYAAVWIIHGTYIAALLRRYRRLQREMNSLPKS